MGRGLRQRTFHKLAVHEGAPRLDQGRAAVLKLLSQRSATQQHHHNVVTAAQLLRQVQRQDGGPCGGGFMTHHDRRGFGGVHGMPAALHHHPEAGERTVDAPTR